jgi:hypothetical protein
MGLYNFKTRFVEPIRKGLKTHTIRGKRKYPAKPGETLYLYCGARHPGAFRIIEPTLCTKVAEITFDQNGAILVEDVKLSLDECEQLARRDGFNDLAEMMQFWDGRFPFLGDIIHWKPPACPDCDAAARFAYSDKTTAGFFHDKCEVHRANPS